MAPYRRSPAHHPISAMALMVRQTLEIAASLRRCGCRILCARILPQAVVRIDRAPADLHDRGLDHMGPSRAHPGERAVLLGGVLVAWGAEGREHGAGSRKQEAGT